MVRRHIDQMMRTSNFKAGNAMIETGVSFKSQKGKNVFVDRKVREHYQRRATGLCSRGDSFEPRVSFWSRIKISFYTSKAPIQIDSRKPSKVWSQGRKSFWKEMEKACTNFFRESVRIRHVIIGILPHVTIKCMHRDATSATNVCSDTEADGQRSEKS